ncbi:SDR family oxidoreductase [Paenibacillus sp. N1-5-1-14]|uniref:SDR family oxidoreductase n=1 Tax=Paenibacillus radicibacter TaxID=2972488 RepID=UPI002159B05E|nr:SDR family oxidoreductase [Paenibacillus radicibacter]MCR8645289.1 SDR family oxidoreductase [Paenibacillus radicibacter]
MIEQRKVALITGSSSGLGRTTAMALAHQGYDIAVNYVHSVNEAHLLVSQIQEVGVQAVAIQADVSITADVHRLVDETQRLLGGIDILVNNAGPFVRERRLFADYSLEEIDYLVRGNLLSVMQLDALVLPHMRTSGWGRIIHFGFGRASEARGWPHRAVYAAAKVGLVSFTKTLAEEEAANGITVNMIAPGDIRGANKEKMIAEALHIIDEETPRGRPGTGEDVSRMIAFLCLPQSDFITGNVIDITGGLDPIKTIPVKKKATSLE